MKYGVRIKCVPSRTLAVSLIDKGFRVIGIEPHRDNRDRSVFVFEYTPELMKAINEFRSAQKNSRANDVDVAAFGVELGV